MATKMSQKQAYVLANLDRVEPLLYKIAVRSPSSRYQLDGWECTPQITGLVVRDQVVKRSNGMLERNAEAPALAAAAY